MLILFILIINIILFLSKSINTLFYCHLLHFRQPFIHQTIIKMDIGNIRSLYQASSLSSNGYGVEGYFV